MQGKDGIMTSTEQYIKERDEQVKENMGSETLFLATDEFTSELVRTNYTKNFCWLGIPIIQYPSDLIVMQEIIWDVKPDFIIETGVAHGGMTRFYATILKAIGKGKVLGVDIEIREHAWRNKESDNLNYWIEFFQFDSVKSEWLQIARSIVKGKTVLVSLDSNHTHEHVLNELMAYGPMVSVGSYIVVFDTAIQFYGHLDPNQDRPWGVGNNPYTATQEFLKTDLGKCFKVDREVERRALITAAPGGWLRRVK
jgi:cephalosporin hydroxylase